jgi:two-component system chemotaxis sensor kinase CheA
MDDIIKEFLVESHENLDRLDQELVQLESDPQSRDLLSSVFRTIHTIKGSCGFLGFAKLEKVAHAGENLLSRLRDGELLLTAEITSELLALVDAVRQMLGAIQATGGDGSEEYASLIENLKRLQIPPSPNVEKPGADRSVTSDAIATQLDARAEAGSGDGSVVAPEEQSVAAETPANIPACSTQRPTTAEAVQALDGPRTRDPKDQTIRVDVTRLDRLMNLAGELVLARNRITQFTNRQSDAAFSGMAQQLNLLTSELQEEVMRTRMQPISHLFDKFPRVVRDLVTSCGKQVQIEIVGKETELDKSLLEAIKDPLTHLVRNAVDHGIEMPAERTAAGKRAEGRLLLRAAHEGGNVVIGIEDDGAGVDRERVKGKAIERGLITTQQAARMSDRELLNLLFLPGFSTAAKVTNISGRGVGMDVVKTNIEHVNGSVELESEPGKGTLVRIKIPLTLAIVPALIVQSAGKRFAVPQVSLVELVRLEENATNRIENVHGAPVYRLRGQLLPLAFLDKELGLQNADGANSSTSSAFNIIVLQADDRQFGLVVDEITDTEEIVVKPLGKQLKGLSVYSGATIMGDGRVALILDVPGLARHAQVVAEGRESERDRKDATRHEEAVSGRQALLLVQNGSDVRMAIPLALVARLEEFPQTSIEHTGGQEVMQYRGQIMPLLRLRRILEGASPLTGGEPGGDGPMQVVVYSEAGRSVGLVVDHIVDIVEEKLTVENPARRPGVLGSSVIQQRVTDLLDVPAIVHAAIPAFAETGPRA